jgi:biotin synthase
MKISEAQVNELIVNNDLPDEALAALIDTDEFDDLLFKAADAVRREVYGDEVYIRGLIEFSNTVKTTAITAA